MSCSLYPYATGDLLVDRNSYSYSAFQGEPFLGAWSAERERVRRMLPGPFAAPAPRATVSPPVGGGFATADLLEFLLGRVAGASGAIPSNASAVARAAGAAIRGDQANCTATYNARHRAVDRAEFRDLVLYVRFAETLALAQHATGSLPHLSTLLKCMDTLCALHAELDAELAARVARLIGVEHAAVRAVAEHSVPGDDGKDAEPATTAFERGRESPGIATRAVPIPLTDVILLAAYTARSRAYLDALIRAGLRPAGVLLYRRPQPDLSQPLRATCESAGWPVTEIAAEHVHDAPVIERLRALRPRLVIYSGYGGQIVSPEALDAAGGFLHLHAGWLPEERGSTTIYYSLLREGRCAVSALLLAPAIDAGPIIARRRYPVPPAGTDVDRVYDSAIRADLLVSCLRGYARHGGFPDPLPQKPGSGTMHYIIHPVLKHIALLRLPESTPPSAFES